MRLKLLFAMLMFSSLAYGQQFGLSFSYFIPKDGYFSTPISPFSIRGLGVDLNRFIALETGASLYRMSGLNIKDLPFESRSPLAGPNFTILVPAEIVFKIGSGSNVEFDVKGGVFGFWGFDQRINYGNFDKAIKKFENWQVANSSFSFDNNPGWGFHFGAELTIYVTQQVGISLESNYLMGDSKFPLKGSYSGGTSTIETRQVEYPDAKIDLTGLEFSIGIIFDSGQAGPPKKKRRR